VGLNTCRDVLSFYAPLQSYQKISSILLAFLQLREFAVNCRPNLLLLGWRAVLGYARESVPGVVEIVDWIFALRRNGE